MSYLYVGLYYSKGKTSVGPNARDLPVASSVPLAFETITSSAGNTRTTIAPTAAMLRAAGLPDDDASRLIWIVHNAGTLDAGGAQVGTPVHLKCDGTATPTATAAVADMTDCLHPRDYWKAHCTAFGEKLAFFDADLVPG